MQLFSNEQHYMRASVKEIQYFLARPLVKRRGKGNPTAPSESTEPSPENGNRLVMEMKILLQA